MPARKIVYAGVGKSEEEIRYALRSRILMFNVESGDELREIDRIAGGMKVKAPVALRINPDIDPQTHPYISTGLKKHKFGIPIEHAVEYYALAQRLTNIEILGVHKHIGSQLTKVSPFVDSLRRILVLVDDLKQRRIRIRYLDVGGGLGITYRDETPPHPSELARNLLPLIADRGLTIVLEPGSSIVGNAGILVTKTLYLKEGEDKQFVIVDAGMNDARQLLSHVHGAQRPVPELDLHGAGPQRRRVPLRADLGLEDAARDVRDDAGLRHLPHHADPGLRPFRKVGRDPGRAAAAEVLPLRVRDPALRARARPRRQGPAARGRARARRLRAFAATIRPEATQANNSARHLVTIAQRVLEGMIALGEGRTESGIARLEEAVELEDRTRYDEPTDWLYPVRHMQGAALLS